MHVVHTHDPTPEPSRLLTNEQIGLAAKRAHDRMWEYAALGEFPLASVCAHARDRMLDVLFARSSSSLVGVDEGSTEQG